jgi:hypothetical protein
MTGLAPSPKLNPDASNQSAKTMLTLPFVRPLRAQSLKNSVTLSNLTCSVGCHDLHDRALPA